MIKKKIFAATAAVLAAGALSATAFAYTGSFNFYLSKNSTSASSSVSKDDNEQKAYVTPNSGDLASGDVFGFRVRTEAGSMATEYKTWTSFTTKTLNYSLLTGVPGNNYKLYGQVDSTSTYSAQHVVGVWTP